MKPKVLVVEDNRNNRKLFCMVLRALNVELLVARTGMEALEQIQRHHPAVVIMDIQLPEINGLEVIARVRKDPTTAKIPIVAVTAYAMKGDREKILACGATDYVSKPIDTRAFPRIIQDHLSMAPTPCPLVSRSALKEGVKN